MKRSEFLPDDRLEAACRGIPSHPEDAGVNIAPLSIGLVSPGWPLDAFPNGIITHVAGVAEGMRTLGHRTTILAGRVSPGDRDDSVYDLEGVRTSQGPVRRVLDGLGYRLAPLRTLDRVYRRVLVATARRAIAERGIQLFEMEESFGWADRLQREIAIPVCIRLHGPWFLNGTTAGIAEDAAFRRRVAGKAGHYGGPARLRPRPATCWSGPARSTACRWSRPR